MVLAKSTCNRAGVNVAGALVGVFVIAAPMGWDGVECDVHRIQLELIALGYSIVYSLGHVVVWLLQQERQLSGECLRLNCCWASPIYDPVLVQLSTASTCALLSNQTQQPSFCANNVPSNV
jgi:hypothetical protein